MPQLLFNTREPELDSFDLNEVVLKSARSGRLVENIFIVPTQRKRRELERLLTTEHYTRTGTPIEHIPLHTLGSFAQQLYRTIAPERRDVSPELQVALMERAMKSIDLDYYARGGEPSAGLIEQLTRVINGVRVDGIMPSDFARDIEIAESMQDGDRAGYDIAKLRDIYNIYSEYLRLLGERWIDYSGKLLHVNTALFGDREKAFRGAFPLVRRIFVHGFSEFTQPEITMLQQLGYVADLSVMILFDYAEENGPLYGNFDEVIAKLRTSGYRKIDLDPLEIDIPEEERRPFIHHMRKNLFRTDERILNSGFDHMLSVYGFFNREEEVQGIAAMIKWLVAEEGYLPESICVTAYNMEPYTTLMREQLAAHGIPANVTASFTLERNALVTAIFSALHIVASNYDRRDVIRAITSPYLDFGPHVDPSALTEAARQLRITRGERTWRMRIRNRLDYVLPQLNRSIDADTRKTLDQELELLRRAETSIVELVKMLSSIDRRMTPSEFRSAFMTLVARLHVAENILHLRHELESRPRTPQDWQRVHDEIERDTRALAELQKLIDELTEFFETEQGPEAGARPLEFYLTQLRIACSRSLYQIREKHDYGVLVAPISQVRDLPHDVTIVCGMVDGDFPSTYIPESFLGRPLPNAQERRLRRERVEFYHALTLFRDRLVLTYPRFAGEKELVRSSFLDAFLRITTAEETGRSIQLDELRPTRERMRQGVEKSDLLAFLPMIATYERLAEEGGRALWGGVELPRIDAAEEMIENLRHTVTVERGRARARIEEDETIVPEYRGIIGLALDERERRALQERRGNEYSPSQLELYARCPFKYYARRVLGIEPAPDFDVTLTPLERGSILHSVLFKLYTELRAQGALPITEATRRGAIDRAKEIAKEEIAGIVFDHPYWRIDQERLLGGDAFGGLLEQWIDSDIERSERSALEPGFFEASFGEKTFSGGGSDTELSAPEEVELHSVKVRGRVDRVEIYRKEDEIHFMVADYKTGVPPTRADINDGQSLQLMIYMEVVRQMLAEHYEMPLDKVKPVGGVYYRLHARDMDTKDTYMLVPQEVREEVTGQKRKVSGDPETIGQLEERITQAFAFAEEYIDGISSGRYHVTTRKVSDVCRGCEYQTICRVSEDRA